MHNSSHTKTHLTVGKNFSKRTINTPVATCTLTTVKSNLFNVMNVGTKNSIISESVNIIHVIFIILMEVLHDGVKLIFFYKFNMNSQISLFLQLEQSCDKSANCINLFVYCSDPGSVQPTAEVYVVCIYIFLLLYWFFFSVFFFFADCYEIEGWWHCYAINKLKA